MQHDVQITDVRMRLEPRQGRVPFEPLVECLSLAISADAFGKIVHQCVCMVADRAPVEVELGSARLTEDGAEIVAKVKRSILKADLRARLTFESAAGKAIRVRIADLDAPAWVPTGMVLEQGMAMAAARPGFSRVPEDARAIDIDPAALMASRGIPAKLAQPGVWSVNPGADVLGVAFRAGS